MQYTDAHKQLAKAIMDTHQAREASYVWSNPDDPQAFTGYTLSIHEAAEKHAPAEFFVPVSCLLTAGFAETFEWCREVLAS
jgi:hypothetical protein